MSWFDRQVRQIKNSDQEDFENSIFRMASVVLGKHDAQIADDERMVTKAALDEILKYYHYKSTEIPASVKDPEDQMDYCLRPHGVMRRNIRLEEGWYKDSFGPVLAQRKEDGHAVALLPRKVMGYYFHDPVTGEEVKLNKTTAQEFSQDAICFYRPLPLKKLGIRDLMLYLKGCIPAGDVVIFILLTIAVTLVGMITPRVTRTLTGVVLQSHNVPFLMGTAVFMVCVAISSMLFNAVKKLGLNRIQTKASISMEAALMARIMNLPAGFFRQYASGDLSSRYNSTKKLCNLILNSIFSTGITSVVSLLYIAQIAQYAPALVTPAICIILLTVGISMAASVMQIRISKAAMETSARNSGLSYALINGVQKIKLAGAEKRAFARWANSYAETAKYSYDIPVFLKVNSAITLAVSLFGTIILYYLAVRSHVTPSDYMAFNVSYGAVMGAFSALTEVALSIANIKPILEMAEPILKTEPESAENKSMITSLSGNIELSNVYFRYTESMPYVVDGMSLKIRPGEYIGIVGTTGCGKSTLVRLLLGFETPERGAVFYDNMDVTTVDLRSLRRRIGAVTQDGSLFQGDIYSNIVISAPQLTLKEAWEAAEIAGIADDIRAMPMGMHTIISEGQGGISGGQKQRLMIARAVAPKPKILIFDEATSALDNKTQKKVSEALDALRCTRIVIAHRLSTIRHCDRILVLDKGHIMEDGTYDELIAKKGLFAELVKRQRLDTDVEQL